MIARLTLNLIAFSTAMSVFQCAHSVWGDREPELAIAPGAYPAEVENSGSGAVGNGAYEVGSLDEAFRQAFAARVRAFGVKADGKADGQPTLGEGGFEASLRRIVEDAIRYGDDRLATRDIEAAAYANEYLQNWRRSIELSNMAIQKEDCRPSTGVSLIRCLINVGDTEGAIKVLHIYEEKFGGRAVALGFVPVIAEKQISLGNVSGAVDTLKDLVDNIVADPLKGDRAAATVAANSLCRVADLTAIAGLNESSWAQSVKGGCKELVASDKTDREQHVATAVDALLQESRFRDLECCALHLCGEDYTEEAKLWLAVLGDGCKRHKWQDNALKCELVRAADRVAKLGRCDKELLELLVGLESEYQASESEAANIKDTEKAGDRLYEQKCDVERIKASVLELRLLAILNSLQGQPLHLVIDPGDVDKLESTDGTAISVLVFRRMPEDSAVLNLVQALGKKFEVASFYLLVAAEDGDENAGANVIQLASRVRRLASGQIDISGGSIRLPLEELQLPMEFHAFVVVGEVDGTISHAMPIDNAMRTTLPFYCASCFE